MTTKYLRKPTKDDAPRTTKVSCLRCDKIFVSPSKFIRNCGCLEAIKDRTANLEHSLRLVKK